MPDRSSDATPWTLPDEKLLAACRIESFASSGPGGQNKNRSAAAVRITHLGTKIHAAATDSRSHRENQIHALRELRHKLALELRRDIPDPITYRPPEFFAQYPALRINPKNPLYPSAVAEVLDVLKWMQYHPARTAVMLGVTTSALTRFLHDDPPLWTKVNQVRKELGMPALQRR